MGFIPTKSAKDVFAPTTDGGQPRGASMGEAQTWGVEVEQGIKSNDSRLTGAEADITLLQAADADTRLDAAEADIAQLQTDVAGVQSDVEAVQALASAGVVWKAAVRVATTGAGTLASSFANGSTVDGVALATGNRILIKNQAAPAENGIYTVNATGAPTRASDADAASELEAAAVFVDEGTTNAGTQWVCTSTGITIGTTGITFAQINDQSDIASELTTARGGLPNLHQAIDLGDDTLLTEIADRVFDPMTPTYRSGRIGVEAALFANAAGHAMPFTWDGTRFDYVKVWVRPAVVTGYPVRVAIWSADRSTLIASGYAISLHRDSPAYIWVKLDRAVTASVASAGVLYLSVDGMEATTSTHKRVTLYYVNDRQAPDLATYPLYYTPYTTSADRLEDWVVQADDGTNGIVFELYNSQGTARRRQQLANPRSDEIVMTPRLAGIVGTELNVYPESLISARGPKQFHLSGIASPARQLSERWTITPTAAVAADTLTLKVLDPDDLIPLDSKTTILDIVAANAAAGASRVICAMGDSTTANGLWIQRVLDQAAANLNGAQPTFQGTQGSGAALHEGVAGRRLIHFYHPTTSDIFANNPFVATLNGYFDANYYMTSNPGFVTPDIVMWHLGLNEAIAQISTSETVMQSVATLYCQQLAEMIGVEASANPVVPWSSVDAGIKHIVALPIATGGQDGFGIETYAGLDYQEAIIHRYLHVLRQRIAKVFGGSEGDGIFLIPWHVTNDPVNGYSYTTEPWNANTARTTERADDSIHPNAFADGGYQQMGDSFWGMLNCGVAKGWF